MQGRAHAALVAWARNVVAECTAHPAAVIFPECLHP